MEGSSVFTKTTKRVVLYELMEVPCALQASISESTNINKQVDELIKLIHSVKELEEYTKSEKEEESYEELLLGEADVFVVMCHTSGKKRACLLQLIIEKNCL